MTLRLNLKEEDCTIEQLERMSKSDSPLKPDVLKMKNVKAVAVTYDFAMKCFKDSLTVSKGKEYINIGQPTN